MTIIDTGTQGAKRQHADKYSPLPLFMEIMNTRGKLDPTDPKLRARFVELIATHPDGERYMASFLNYWFDHSLARFTLPARTSEDLAEARTMRLERQRLRTIEVQRALDAKASRMFLEMTLPNGKTVAESTFGQCAKAGGLLSKIGKLGKPRQKVGDVFASNEQLAERLVA